MLAEKALASLSMAASSAKIRAVQMHPIALDCLSYQIVLRIAIVSGLPKSLPHTLQASSEAGRAVGRDKTAARVWLTWYFFVYSSFSHFWDPLFAGQNEIFGLRLISETYRIFLGLIAVRKNV
jgi:hypothetical protein